MALALTIGGIDRTANTRFESLQIVNTITSNADVADFVVSIPNASTWRPKAGNEVIVTNGATREFAGFALDVTETWPAGTRLKYKVACKDYLYLFNRKLFVGTSTDASGSSAPTADQVVKGIIATSTDGFSSTGVLSAPASGIESFNYVPRGDIIRKIADQVGFVWYIDYNKVVNFGAAVVAAPVAAINLDTDFTNYGNCELIESAGNVKNRIYVQGFKQKTTTSYNYSALGNGASEFWYTGYEPSSIGDVTATLNGVPLTVLTDGVDGSAGDTVGSSSVVFCCFTNMGFRMNNYAPTSTETLAFATTIMKPGFWVLESAASQADFAAREVSDGVHEYNVNDPGVTAVDGSLTLASLRASALINRDGPARLTAKFVSYTQGWRAGQQLALSSANRMGGFNKTFYIQEVRKKLINHPSGGTPTIYYELTAADGALAQ